MNVKQKIIIGAIAAVVVMLLLLLWAFFAYEGKTPIDPFIYQLASLITIVVGLVSAFFGHQAATTQQTPIADDAVRPASVSYAIAPLPASTVEDAPASAPAPASVAAANTLQ